MVRLTLELLRSRTEHHDGPLTTLRALALHQLGLERIELLNQACRHLTSLYLNNNIISCIENLNRLKELQNLNLAINNITFIENLGRCESLRRLDLTLNFIPLPALPSVASLRPCYDLRELHLLGNPCTQWSGYRAYVVASLPQLTALDGEKVTAAERAAAEAAFSRLEAELTAIIEGFGVYEECGGQEEGQAGGSGEKQQWCPTTRVEDQKESEKRKAEAAAAQAAAAARLSPGEPSPWRQRPLRDALPEIDDNNDEPLQCNEGDWDFTLEEDEEREMVGRRRQHCLVLTVKLEPYLDIHKVQVDVHPRVVRVLARGRLLQLRLPAEVTCDAAQAQRSTATGRLVITMPIIEEQHHGILYLGRKRRGREAQRSRSQPCDPLLLQGALKPLPPAAAAVHVLYEHAERPLDIKNTSKDDDFLPPLPAC